MKLDRYDIALANGAFQGDSRPILQNIHLNKGKLEVADGSMLLLRDADVEPGEKEITALLPAKLVKIVKSVSNKQAVLTLKTEEIQVQYQDDRGQPIKFNPVLTLRLENAKETYPKFSHLFPKDTAKTAHIALGVGRLKRLLSCLPDESILRIGLTTPIEPMEFECSNMERPIRGLLMPMSVDWEGFEWHRSPLPTKEKDTKEG